MPRDWLRSLSAFVGASVVGGVLLARTGLSWWAALATAGAGVVGAFAPEWKDVWLEYLARRRKIEDLNEPRFESSPTSLLRAEMAVVPFSGRDGELAALRAWCENSKACPVLLMTGPGGVGKSRLALQLVVEMREAGWPYTVLRARMEADAAELVDSEPKRLLVVDYAETRAGLDELLRHLAARTDRRHIRLLLIARSAGEWWERLGADEPAIRALVAAAPTITVGPVFAPDTDNEALVRRAMPYFAAALGVEPSRPVPSRIPDTPVAPLVLHAIALVAVLRDGDHAIPDPPTENAIFDELLRHEAHLWLSSRPSVMAGASVETWRAVAALTCLHSPSDLHEAGDVLIRVPELRDTLAAPRRDVARRLHQLYPPASGRWWSSLGPDLLAERLVCRALTETPELVTAYFDDADVATAENALTVLARATEHQDDAARLIGEVLRSASPPMWEAAMAVAVQTGGKIGSVLAEVLADIELPVGELIRIREAMPFPSTACAAAAAVVTQRIVDGMPPETDAPERARWFGLLGSSLREVGRLTEALSATGTSVELYRGLPAEDADRYLPLLADALSDLGVRQSELGHPQEALVFTEEAVTLWRRLAAGGEADRRSRLASALNDLGVRHMELGEFRDGLEPTAEAIEIFRELAADGSEAALRDLGGTLSNQGVNYQGLGDPERAVVFEREAIAIWRDLVAVSPDRYLPDLAWSLAIFGIRLSQLGRWEEAFAASREGVEIDRGLVAANPGLHLGTLARDLAHLGIRFADLDRSSEALAVTEEAAAIRRLQFDQDPDRNRNDLGYVLAVLGSRLGEAGRIDEALAVTEEAVTLRRASVAVNPGRFRRDLAPALRNLSMRLADADRTDESLTMAREAVALYRELVAQSPSAFSPGLADALVTLSNALAAAGHGDSSLPPAQEAVAIYREVPPGNLDPHAKRRRAALRALAERLEALGRGAEAAEVRREFTP